MGLGTLKGVYVTRIHIKVEVTGDKGDLGGTRLAQEYFIHNHKNIDDDQRN